MTGQTTTRRTARPAAVYITWETWLEAVTTLTELGVPPELDRSVWSNQPPATQPQILGAFRFLGLIDRNGVPQESLNQLVAAMANGDEPSQQKIVRSLLESSYPQIIESAAKNSSNQKFREIMRDEYRVSGSTLDRAVRFFRTPHPLLV